MTQRPCIGCGEPTGSTRCPSCAPVHARTLGSAHRRGYTAAHRRLSARARKAQPFCRRCGTDQDLTLHHTEEAWRRHYAGKPARLSDYEVLCRRHNIELGSTR